LTPQQVYLPQAELLVGNFILRRGGKGFLFLKITTSCTTTLETTAMRSAFRTIIFLICLFFMVDSVSLMLFAQEWQLLGLEAEKVIAIAVDPFDEKIIYAGSASDFSAGKRGSLFKSTNGGASWDTLLAGVTVTDIDIHPFNSQIIYMTGGINFLTPSGIFKSMDGGKNWIKADSGIRIFYSEEGPYVLAIDPLHPDTLYAGTGGFFGGNLYKTTDGGKQWQAIGDGTYILNGVAAIAIDPKNTRIVYVGTAQNGALLKSIDGGKNWKQLNFPDVGIVHDLLVHPLNSDIVYAGTWYHGFYFSRNAGTSWQRANAGLPDTNSVRKIVTAKTKVYIAANDRKKGASYESFQNNINWKMVGNKSFEQGVNFVSYSAKQNRLLLGAPGIYKLTIRSNVESLQEKPLSLYRLWQNYPNPFNAQTMIKYYLQEKAFVRLTVYDVSNRLIRVLVHETQHPGEYRIKFDADNLASGIYFYQLQAGSHIQTQKFVLIR
jgi:photosystem II stability/assembly factor-like uncharacterized protein